MHPQPAAPVSLFRRTIENLGGPRVLGSVNNLLDLDDCIGSGLPYASFDSLQSELSFPVQELIELLDIPRRTLDRRRDAGRFKPDESDRLARIARVFARAVDVLGSEENASQWFERPSRALGGRAPRTLLRSDAGTREIEDMLGRIEHGVFA